MRSPPRSRPLHLRTIPASARHLLLLLALVAAPATEARGQALGEDAREAWTALVADYRELLDAEGVVGGTLALVREGEVVARAHHGWAVVEEGWPVDAATLFHWASITKTFTAVSILQLRDRGLLSLEDPVLRYVPELGAVHNPFGPMEDVTLRHLLSHAAGFRSSTFPWDGGEAWQPWEPTEWAQLVAMMPYTRIDFPPGSRFQYSNPGIVFLGRTLEAITGDVFEAYVEKNVFRPLGMATAYFDTTPWHLEEHRAQNYRVVGNEPVPNGDFNTGVTVSNGGLNASVDDLARWIGFLTGHAVSEVGRQVLRRGSLEEMWREAVPIREMELGREGMGLGFFLYPDLGLVGHTGSQRSFFSFILFDPATGVGAIGAFNTAGGDETGPDTRALLNRIRERVARDVLPMLQR
ncbi:MAG: beta-lactamase family protein [Gemmatimonadales bacterium]|nr:MAG: beta-lactamase family protein [Gemmatimonadales bacterium]